MSIIKSSADHLTLEADGVGKDVKFNCNGVQKASISSAGAFTSTTIDATVLTGALPAISGASLTNLPAGGASAIDGLSDGTTTGTNNVGLGSTALDSLTSGFQNTAVGVKTMTALSTGDSNTGMGFECMDNAVITGAANTGIGQGTLRNLTSGSNNTAVGLNALKSNSTGYENVAVGRSCMDAINTGYENTAIGNYAGNTLTTGTENVTLGRGGQPSSATTTLEFTLGGGSISNLRCNDTSISSLSDQRDKAEITDLPDSAGLDLINALRPVTYYWDRREWYDNNTPDGSKIKPDFRSWKSNSGQRQGFIAQEVESAISGHKYLEDSGVVSGTEDKKEFAPQHLLTNAIKAIQQLSAEMEILKSEIATLKGV